MKITRQNVLIGIVVAAVLFVGADLLVLSAPKTSTATTTLSTATKDIVTTINKKLAASSLTPMAKDRLYLAVQPWKDDPFLERELIGNSGLFTQERNKPEHQLSFVYSGYVQVGSQLFPVINGIEYVKGELIEESNMQVYQTTKDSVILRDIDSPVEDPRLVTIPIEQEPIFSKSHSSRQG